MDLLFEVGRAQILTIQFLDGLEQGFYVHGFLLPSERLGLSPLLGWSTINLVGLSFKGHSMYCIVTSLSPQSSERLIDAVS